MARDRLGASVICGKGQGSVAELVEHHQKVARRAVEVLGDIVGIDAEIAGSARHQLSEADGANRASRDRVVGTLNFNIGAVEERPVGDGEPRTTQSAMPGISQGGGLDRIKNFCGGANGTRSRDRHLSDYLRATWYCEKKKAIRRLLGLGEGAQGACVIRDGIQSAIRTNRENETVGTRPCFSGQGRGTYACTQNNDERKGAVSCP